MIKEISFINVKGQTGTQELTGMDLFIGPNGSGKTTRIQSLGLGLLGYVPGQEKTAAETFKLATGEDMTVGIKTEQFSANRTFQRQLKTSRKTGEKSISISESISVSPGQGERNDTERKARIVAELGSFPVMFDFQEFLNLSDAKRRDFIYGLSPVSPDSWSRERINEYLCENLLTLELEINNREQHETMEQLIGEVMEQFPGHYNTHQGLQSMIDWTATALSKWNSKKKDTQGAVRSIAEAKNKLAETDRNIAQQKSELEEIQSQLVKLEKQISRDTEILKSIRARVSRIEELRSLIDGLENQPVGAGTSALEQRLSELKNQLVAEEDPEEQLLLLRGKKTETEQKRSLLLDQAREIRLQNTEIRATVQSLEAALTETGKLGGRCVIHKMISCPKDFAGLGDFISQKKAQADEAIAENDRQYADVSSRINDLEQVEAELQAEIDGIYKKRDQIAQENRLIEKQIRDLEKEIVDIETARERRDNRLSLYQEELQRLLDEKPEPIGDIEVMGKQVAGLRSRESELKGSIEEKSKARQTILLLQQSMIDNKAAEYKTACLKSLQEALGPKGIQGEIVKDLLEPIRKDIQANLRLMGFDHEPYFLTETETGKEVFRFGWINDLGHQVDFNALSTGQQTVFLAAMMVTIIDRARPKLKVLAIDNMNHMDRDNLALALHGISQLRDRLDNIILAGAVEVITDEAETSSEDMTLSAASRFIWVDDLAAQGWCVWDLGKKEAVQHDRKSA